MKKILIDLEKCYKEGVGGAKCSYYYHQGSLLGAETNNGVEKLLAKAAQYVICRQCKRADCVLSCPNDALEKNSEGILQRYSGRCTSCKSCSVACPFGTIYPEILPYKTSMCDYCEGRTEEKPPLCVETCNNNAIQWVEMEEDPAKHIYKISDKLLVQSLKWKK